MACNKFKSKADRDMKVDLIVAVKLTLIKYRVDRGKHFSSEIFFINSVKNLYPSGRGKVFTAEHCYC